MESFFNAHGSATAAALHSQSRVFVVVQDNGYGARGALTAAELQTLADMACGLTDKAIAGKRHMSVRGVQNRITSIFHKLLGPESQELGSEGVINLRVKAVCTAIKRGILDINSLAT